MQDRPALSGQQFIGEKKSYGIMTYSVPLPATQAWPRDALEAVARKALRQAELSEAERETLVELCQDFHRKASGL